METNNLETHVTLPTPILIVGGHGMLGQDVARVLAEYNPIVWDRAELDITDEAAVLEKFRELKPAIVINTAAFNAVDDAEKPEVFAVAMKVNADGPGNLARACKEIDALFVHYSTDYVFDGTKKDGYTEIDTPNPQSNYARSKRAGEEQVLAAGGKVFVARTCKLFGKPGVSDMSKKSFVDMMLELAQTRESLDVVDEEFASPTYTPDLADQTKVLLEKALQGEIEPGIFHITNTGACTWFEFAQEIFRIQKEKTGKEMTLNPVPASTFPRPATRPKFSMLLNTKLPATRSWQDALAAYLETKSE